MRIITAKHLGVCYGVKKALEIAERFTDKDTKAYTLGPLIHNNQVVESLNKRGVMSIESLNAIEGGTVIIRSHGVPPEIHGEAAHKVVELIDATCPFVRKIQEKVKEYYARGYQIIIVGDAKHPEVKGVNGWCDYSAIILDNPGDAEELKHYKKLCVVAQTTIPFELWDIMKPILEEKGDEVESFNTICNATYLRQQAAKELSKQVDAMLVIGGLHSSNTQKLYRLCKAQCEATYHIETAKELPLEHIKGVGILGITAGASTPDWIIKEVIDKMTELDNVKQERENMQDDEKTEIENTEAEVEDKAETIEERPEAGDADEAPEDAPGVEDATDDEAPEDAPGVEDTTDDEAPEDAPGVEDAADDEAPEDTPGAGDIAEAAKEELEAGDAAEAVEKEPEDADEITDKEAMIEGIEDSIITIRPGKVVKGTVMQVGDKEVIVNIGYKADGIITKEELSNDPALEPSDVVQVGDEIEVFVRKIDEKEGSVSLSKKKVDIEKAWKLLKDKHETGEPVDAKILEEVNAGLIAIAEGIKGFVPASHVDIGYVEVLQDFVGQELSMKVIEFNRSKGKVIFSRKALLQAERERKKKEVLSTLKAGDRIEGEVKRLTGFGAFVDVGGIDGLVHISEISWHRIGHPSEVLETGQNIEVLVLGVERERERISLSIKQIMPHPWDNIEDRFAAGDIISGKVVRLVDFGAFVELEPGVEGLVHISQIAYEHVDKPQDVLEEGQEVKVKVLDLRPKDRRVSLSIKETMERPTREENKGRTRPQQPLNEEEQPITIGELVGDIFKENKEKDE